MWKRALSANSFLESCTSSSTTVDFSIEETDVDQLSRQRVNMRLHNFGRISSCKGPYNVASGVTHMRSYAMVTEIYIIDKGLLQNWHKTCEPIWHQQAASTQFSQS